MVRLSLCLELQSQQYYVILGGHLWQLHEPLFVIIAYLWVIIFRGCVKRIAMYNLHTFACILNSPLIPFCLTISWMLWGHVSGTITCVELYSYTSTLSQVLSLLLISLKGDRVGCTGCLFIQYPSITLVYVAGGPHESSKQCVACRHQFVSLMDIKVDDKGHYWESCIKMGKTMRHATLGCRQILLDSTVLDSLLIQSQHNLKARLCGNQSRHFDQFTSGGAHSIHSLTHKHIFSYWTMVNESLNETVLFC